MSENMRRTRTVSVRFNEAEYDALCWLCEEQDGASPAQLIRALVANTVEAREADDGAATVRELEENLERLHGWLLGRAGRHEPAGKFARNR